MPRIALGQRSGQVGASASRFRGGATFNRGCTPGAGGLHLSSMSTAEDPRRTGPLSLLLLAAVWLRKHTRREEHSCGVDQGFS